MESEDPRHGTLRGHYAGCRELCCRTAVNAYERIRRQKIALYGTSGLFVDSLGSRRRIEALFALGWFAREIAAECGWERRNDIHSIFSRSQLKKKTADAIATAFERMCMRTPEPGRMRTRQINHAVKKGWAPPLAWDDIDNPNERPKGVAYYTKKVA